MMTKSLFILMLAVPHMMFANSLHEQYEQYIEQIGEPDIVISCFEAGSAYQYCLKHIPKQGMVVIDKQGNEVYQLYFFDSWPDEPKDGLYRIRQGDKIGFADAKTGNIVIDATYDCAFPFENGKANVGTGCMRETDGEHSWWLGGNWHWIDLQGNATTANLQP